MQIKSLENLYFTETPVEVFHSDSNFELLIKREDKTFAGFGVKTKNTWPHSVSKAGNVKDVLLLWKSSFQFCFNLCHNFTH